MKKFISILLLLILCIPINGHGEIYSHNSKELIKIFPEIQFDFINPNFTTIDLEFYNKEKLSEYFFETYNIEKNYCIEDGLILYIKSNLQNVEFSLLNKYKKTNIIYGIFLNEEEMVYIIPAIITENGSLIFNLSSIDPENTIFILLIFDIE